MMRSASETHSRSQLPTNQRSTSYAGPSSSGTNTPHSRHPSREYKETLDARAKDEKDGTRIINQYHLTRVIGQGAYGVVYQGCLRDDPQHVFAVKEFSKTRLKKSKRYEKMRRPPPPQQRRGGSNSNGNSNTNSHTSTPATPRDPMEPIRREIAIMKKLDHPNLVSIIEALDDPRRDELYLVLEYCSGGPIIDVQLHQQTTPLEEEVAQNYFVQILLGLEFLHHHDIIHRDIKPDNVLRCGGEDEEGAGKGGRCKIVDFGVSEMFSPAQGVDAARDPEDRPKGHGTPAFLSPELCSANNMKQQQRRPSGGSPHDKDVDGVPARERSGRRDDVWSLGVTLYCMLVGHLPFDKDNFMDLYDAIRTQEPEYPSHLSSSSSSLLRSMLEKDPAKRITTIESAREQPWVTVEGHQPLVSAARNLEQVVQEVTEEEIKGAICRITSIFTIARAVSKFKRARSRSSMNTSSPGTQSPQLQQEGDAGGAAAGAFGSAIASVVSSPYSSFSMSSPTAMGSPVQQRRRSSQQGPQQQHRRNSSKLSDGGEGNSTGGPFNMLTTALSSLSTSDDGSAVQEQHEKGQEKGASSGEKSSQLPTQPTLTEEPEAESAVASPGGARGNGKGNVSNEECESEIRDEAKSNDSSKSQDQGGEQQRESGKGKTNGDAQRPQQDNSVAQSLASDPCKVASDPNVDPTTSSVASILCDLEQRLERRMQRAWPRGAEMYFAKEEEGKERALQKAAAGRLDDIVGSGETRERQEGEGGQKEKEKGKEEASTTPASVTSSVTGFFEEASRRLPSWLTGSQSSPSPRSNGKEGDASSGVRSSASGSHASSGNGSGNGDGDGSRDEQGKLIRLFTREGEPVVRSPGPAPASVVMEMRKQMEEDV